jgi:hypothetical protein
LAPSIYFEARLAQALIKGQQDHHSRAEADFGLIDSKKLIMNWRVSAVKASMR